MITTSTLLTSKFGDFNISYHKTSTGECISLVCWDITKEIPLVRIHSSCLFWESFFSQHCDCHSQLEESMKLIQTSKAGVIIYSYKEWRWIWLEKKIQAMELQRTLKCDTVEAFSELWFNTFDLRNYDTEIVALCDLKISNTISVISGNPLKIEALEKANFIIKSTQNISPEHLHTLAQEELSTKKSRMNYIN